MAMDKFEILKPGKIISFRSEVLLKVGSIEAAILYENLHFWSDKGKRTDGFIYKTRPDLEEETALHDKQIRNATKRLVEIGWIETKKLIVGNSLTIHYRCLVNINTLLSPTGGNGETPVATGERAVHETAKRRFYNRNSTRPVINNKGETSFKKTEYSQELLQAARDAITKFPSGA